MNNLFNKTKEVTIEEFTAMWNKGGSRVIGSQFSNCDKSDYLMVVDIKASNFKKQKEAELKAFHASIPTYSIGGVGEHPVNLGDALRIMKMREELNSISTTVTNIIETFDAGWGSNSLKANNSQKKDN